MNADKDTFGCGDELGGTAMRSIFLHKNCDSAFSARSSIFLVLPLRRCSTPYGCDFREAFSVGRGVSAFGDWCACPPSGLASSMVCGRFWLSWICLILITFF